MPINTAKTFRGKFGFCALAVRVFVILLKFMG